jgi:hypothetical protein
LNNWKKGHISIRKYILHQIKEVTRRKRQKKRLAPYAYILHVRNQGTSLLEKLTLYCVKWMCFKLKELLSWSSSIVANLQFNQAVFFIFSYGFQLKREKKNYHPAFFWGYLTYIIGLGNRDSILLVLFSSFVYWSMFSTPKCQYKYTIFLRKNILH